MGSNSFLGTEEEFNCTNVETVHIRFSDPGYIEGSRVGMWVKYEGIPEGEKLLRIWWDYDNKITEYRDIRLSDVAVFAQVIEHEYFRISGTMKLRVRVELILVGKTGNCARNLHIVLTEPVQDSGIVCGDGMIEGSEVCDGASLAGEDCLSQGFDGGTLSCVANCMGFDTSGCFVCGDDTIEGAEVCDGADLGGEDCITQGFFGGALACTADCSGLDTSGCF